MGLSHSPKIVTDGLKLYLDAANLKSYPGTGSVWYDLTGINQANTLNSITYSNQVFVLDGISSYISANQQSYLTGNNPWSIDFFINVDSSENGTGRQGWIFWEGPNNQNANELISIAVNSSAIEVAHWSNDTRFANATIDFNSWSHFVVCFDGATETIFKNGISVGSKNTTLSVTVGDIRIGSRINAEYLKCSIGNFKIYNRALNESEVRQNFNALRGRYGL